jgi:predicted NAD/FAD-binding protein
MTSPLEQKIRITGPVVITANRVGDGAVVYRRADEGWTTALDAATVATTPAAAQELVKAAIADDLHAVGSYIAPVKLTTDGQVRPGNLRERIRLRGPTIELPAISGIRSAVVIKGHARV